FVGSFELQAAGGSKWRFGSQSVGADGIVLTGKEQGWQTFRESAECLDRKLSLLSRIGARRVASPNIVRDGKDAQRSPQLVPGAHCWNRQMSGVIHSPHVPELAPHGFPARLIR